MSQSVAPVNKSVDRLAKRSSVSFTSLYGQPHHRKYHKGSLKSRKDHRTYHFVDVRAKATSLSSIFYPRQLYGILLLKNLHFLYLKMAAPEVQPTS